MNMFLGKITIF